MDGVVSLGALVLQVGIVVTLIEGLRRGNVSAAVNSLVALVAALSPEFAAAVVDVPPELTFWVAAAGFLHALGMLGLYESIGWWDHLTHLVSAALVAAMVYAVLIVTVEGSSEGAFPTAGAPISTLGVAGSTLVLTMIAGLFWELIELVGRDVAERLDVEPLLVHYGPRDTALDLVFDLVGALLVVVLDIRLLVPVAEPFPHATRTLLIGGTTTLALGTVAMALGLALVGGRRPWTG